MSAGPVGRAASSAPVIDVHSHHYPEVFVDACRDSSSGLTTSERSDGGLAVFRDGAVTLVVPQPVPSVETRLAALDQSGIHVQLLSLSAPNVYSFPAASRGALTRAVNDEFLSLFAESGGRLQSLVSLPLPDVAGALLEFDRVIGAPGVAGVFLCTTVNGRPLDDEAFQPLLHAMSEAGTTVLVHPTVGCAANQREFALSLNIGFMAETTACIARLLFSGAFERFPGITWVFSHLGGSLPFLHHRIDKAKRAFGDWQRPLARDPLETLGDLYFDTVSDHAPALVCAVSTYGAGSLVFGTDYPHGPGDLRKPLAFVRGTLDREVLDGVLGRTAAEIFAITEPTCGRN